MDEIFRNLPTLETDRLILRKITMEDINDVFEYASDEDVARYTTWNPHQTKEDSKKVIEGFLRGYENGEPRSWCIVHKENKKVIGTCGFIMCVPKLKRAEIGYVISKKYWNKGLATEAAKRVIEFGFSVMGLVRIEAKCKLDNSPSIRVLEKTGMALEGILRSYSYKNGEFYDVKMFSIINR